MLNSKLIEKWFDSSFKPEKFQESFSSIQQQLVGSYQEFSKLAEENNQKVKDYWESQAKLFNLNVLAEKIESVQKLNEENFNKVKSYVEENSTSFNGDAIISEMKKITKIAEENNQKILKVFNANAGMFTSTVVWDQVGKVNKIAEENKDKVLDYFNEQYDFLKALQTELVASMKTEDPTKSFPEAVKKYSETVANSNLKKVEEGFQKIKKVIAQ